MGVSDKEMHMHDQQLIALMVDLRTKGNRRILSFQRWNKERVLLKLQNPRTYATIKMLECAQLKEKKGLVLKKRDIVEAELDAETLEEPISKTMSDFRTWKDARVLDFGEGIN